MPIPPGRKRVDSRGNIYTVAGHVSVREDDVTYRSGWIFQNLLKRGLDVARTNLLRRPLWRSSTSCHRQARPPRVRRIWQLVVQECAARFESLETLALVAPHDARVI